MEGFVPCTVVPSLRDSLGWRLYPGLTPWAIICRPSGAKPQRLILSTEYWVLPYIPSPFMPIILRPKLALPMSLNILRIWTYCLSS